ncbi:unnamed protein product, partial [Meganyctiphanes norvegica]
IVSPMLLTPPETDLDMCFKFHYSSGSQHAGILSVLIWYPMDNSQEKVWKINLYGNNWKEAMMPLQPSSTNFLLVIQAEVWDAREGFIALDKLTLEQEICQYMPPGAKPQNAENRNTNTLTFLQSEAIINCSFEDNEHPICGFEQVDNGATWLRINGSDTPTDLQPDIDHTMKNS